MRISNVVDTGPSLYHPQNKNYIHENPLSPKVFPAGPSLPGPLDAEACLRPCLSRPSLEEKPKCSRPQGQTLVHICIREVKEAERRVKVSLRSSFGLGLHPSTRGRSQRWGCRESLSVVDFWGNESSSKQNAIPRARLLPHLRSNVCSLLLNPINRRTWPPSFRTRLSPLFLLMNTLFQRIPLMILAWHVTEFQFGYLSP